MRAPIEGVTNDANVRVHWPRQFSGGTDVTARRADSWDSRVLFLGVLAILLPVAADAYAASDPWSTLTAKNAWIFLGEWDKRDAEWATQPSHVVKHRTSRHPSALPQVGDVLEIRQDAELLILGFRSTGEARRNESPAGRVQTADNLTGLILKNGYNVRVRRVVLESHKMSREMQGVWALVEPVK